jgi:hypothetical protein
MKMADGYTGSVIAFDYASTDYEISIFGVHIDPNSVVIKQRSNWRTFDAAPKPDFVSISQKRYEVRNSGKAPATEYDPALMPDDDEFDALCIALEQVDEARDLATEAGYIEVLENALTLALSLVPGWVEIPEGVT